MGAREYRQVSRQASAHVLHRRHTLRESKCALPVTRTRQVMQYEHLRAVYDAIVIRVFQLKGGIHNYLEEFGKKGDGLWIGDNYTFDKR